tara:strand:- start:1760 stop:2122 length:363 start_codon:yes stop_codon:yes gene_type:complete
VKDKIKMQVNDFFNTAGTDRNRQVVCADGFTMSVQAHQGAYCSPRMSGAPKYTHVEVGFPSEREDLLMEFAEEPDKPTQTVYGWVPVQTVTNVLAKHGGIVDGEVPFGVAPIPANFVADE